MSEQVVVVGVDGSPASYTALRWALGYVGRTGGRLRAVGCSRPVAVPAWEAAVTGEPVAPVAEQRLRAERELDQVVAAALVRGRAGAAVWRRVVRGPAGPGLVAQVRGAALLVVGSHGHRRLAHLPHGSVSAYCIRHASCPWWSFHRRSGYVGIFRIHRCLGAVGDSAPTWGNARTRRTKSYSDEHLCVSLGAGNRGCRAGRIKGRCPTARALPNRK